MLPPDFAALEHVRQKRETALRPDNASTALQVC